MLLILSPLSTNQPTNQPTKVADFVASVYILPPIDDWVLFVCLVLFCFVLGDRVSLFSLGCPGIHFVDQAGLELRDPSVSASRVLGLKTYATMHG